MIKLNKLPLRSSWVARGLVLSVALSSLACGGAAQRGAEWPPAAKKWFERAAHSYGQGDMEDARLASQNALASLPDEPKVRLLAAEIAMAELHFEEALLLLLNVPGSEASGLRGRAHWYLGHIDQAAEELAVITADPEVKDPWAEATLRLARSGRGRTPYQMTGGIIAAVEMPFAGSVMLVPLEVNGEPSLAMVTTDQSDCVIDSRDNADGSWVSLRFAGRVEVSDVPAIPQDLSGLARQLGAPIKMLIGVQLLRHVNATVDVAGRQFVVRNFEPPAPPAATTINPIFYRGGAMVLPGAFGLERTAPSSTLQMKTSQVYPLALDQGGWTKAGQDPKTFVAVPGEGGLRQSVIPMLRLGAFEIPQVPGVFGSSVEAFEKENGIDIDGYAGSGLFATFRLTFADSGRTLWMEDLPQEVIEMRRDLAARANQRRPGPTATPAPTSSSVPAPASGSALGGAAPVSPRTSPMSAPPAGNSPGGSAVPPAKRVP